MKLLSFEAPHKLRMMLANALICSPKAPMHLQFVDFCFLLSFYFFFPLNDLHVALLRSRVGACITTRGRNMFLTQHGSGNSHSDTSSSLVNCKQSGLVCHCVCVCACVKERVSVKVSDCERKRLEKERMCVCARMCFVSLFFVSFQAPQRPHTQPPLSLSLRLPFLTMVHVRYPKSCSLSLSLSNVV